MTFEDCLAIVLQWEGGYSDHAADPGGATNFGITHHTLKRWRKVLEITKEDVAALTREEAAEIYRAWYWDRCHCGRMPSGLDLLLFDAGVNHGTNGALRMLQETVKVKQDAIIGPVTMAAVEKMDRTKLFIEFSAIRADLYETINKTFERGWYRRQFTLFATALAAGE